MKVVIVDTKSLGIKSMNDAVWILKNFDPGEYQHFWVFEDAPFSTDEKVEAEVALLGVPFVRVMDPVKFIFALLFSDIWVDVEKFILCSKNEVFVPIVGDTLIIRTSERDVYDDAFFRLNGIEPSVYPDYAVILDALGDEHVDGVVEFLKKYRLEDLRSELVRDEAVELGLDSLLAVRRDSGEPFFEELIRKRNSRFLVSANFEGLTADYVIELIYSSRDRAISEPLRRWREEGRRLFYKRCRKCSVFVKNKAEELGNPVLWDGSGRGIVVIGEAPGAEEEKAGLPFVGESGKLLEKWLSLLGLKRSDCWITNAVLCRRKKENVSLQPLDDMISSCFVRLKSEIYENVVDGKVTVICLGKTALKALNLMNIPEGLKHGVYEFDFVRLLFLPHPSFILREKDKSRHLQVIEILKRFKVNRHE